MSDLVREYMTGQLRPGHATLLPGFTARSALTLATLPHDRDVRYGAHERCRFDIFPAGPGAPMVAFFHAGYWQGRDKDMFLFLAEPFVHAGIGWAAVNYPICPDVSFDTLVDAAKAAMPAVRAHAGPSHLVAAGHSAGGHIATELGLSGLADAVVALSGVYDLTPLLETPLNDALRLGSASAHRHSPLFRAGSADRPACFIVGGDETDAFQSQTAQMQAGWPGSTAVIGPGADHFTLLDQLADERSAVHQAAIRLVRSLA